MPAGPNAFATRVASSFVHVEFSVPYGAGVDASTGTSYEGLGIVVDAERGIAVVDRNTVPIGCADAAAACRCAYSPRFYVRCGNVRVTIASAVELPARVIYLHPYHNFGIVQFDASALSPGTLRSMKFAPTALAVGDKACFVGVTDTMAILVQDVLVTKHTPFFISDASSPRFRAHSEDLYSFDSVASCLGGAFVNEDGDMYALWASYSYTSLNGAAAETMKGLPAAILGDVAKPLLAQLATGAFGDRTIPRISLRSLEAELVILKLSKARTAMRLAPEWAARLESSGVGGDRRQALYGAYACPCCSFESVMHDAVSAWCVTRRCVRRCIPGAPSAKVLREVQCTRARLSCVHIYARGAGREICCSLLMGALSRRSALWR